MAVQRGLESRHPPATRLFEDPFSATWVSTPWRLALAAARVGIVRRVLERTYDHFGGPGPRASAVARTRLIDDLLSDATASVKQVVILGAGFDCRAYRLPALSGCRVFEVDHPGTQAFKRRRLRSRREHVTHVAVDFERDDLERALRAGGFDPGRPSVFLWEGVTQYLTAEAVDATLRAVRRLGAPGSALVFTYVDRVAIDQGAAAFPEARRWIEGVQKRGEPWIFGLDPAAVDGYLRARRFALTSDLSTADAGRPYFAAAKRSERGSRLYRVATANVIVRADHVVDPPARGQEPASVTTVTKRDDLAHDR